MSVENIIDEEIEGSIRKAFSQLAGAPVMTSYLLVATGETLETDERVIAVFHDGTQAPHVSAGLAAHLSMFASKRVRRSMED